MPNGLETTLDCAEAAQEELGLDGPDPNDPYTQPDGFLCRHGLCVLKEPGCSDDDDCAALGLDEPLCKLPE